MEESLVGCERLVKTPENTCPIEMIPQDVASEFIHKLSHDVIGVLQNIMGYTTLLSEEFDKSYLEGIGKLTKKLSARMTMAVSDIDSGELNKPLQEFS